MTSPLAVDLASLVQRMASRDSARTEANVQSDLHMLLATAPLQLDDQDLHEIVLESPAGQRRRIDVETGFTVFEVKRDLRAGNVRRDAIQQLAGYVRARNNDAGQRYVGVLTDGAEWHLFNLRDGELAEVSRLEVDPRRPDVDRLLVWLEGVLATATAIAPTAIEIERRLGALSPAHALDKAELLALYDRNRTNPSLLLKRQLWSKLLRTAFGTAFHDDDDLFVEHTLLVVMAEIVGHSIIGFDPTDLSISPATILSGRLFTQDAQIGGVIDADFFDWPTEIHGGDSFVRALARRLGRFSWSEVEHDVMKILYESVISSEQRHGLGEYYTPDWLAESIVAETISDPLNLRVLDPSCGSGTFLFHAVRRYLSAADEAGQTPAEAIEGVCRSVIGLDVHPVAVTLARVTYLLAIGVERLGSEDRPAFNVPVYLGDSMQWGQQRTLVNLDELLVEVEDSGTLQIEELRFPDRLLVDAGRFDRLISHLADKATSRPVGSAVPNLNATFRLFAIQPDEQSVVSATFAAWCGLHDRGRNHIWGYYLRNLARPISLTRPDRRVDLLIGNPPWLAYRFMTPGMKATFRDLAEERGFWTSSSYATSQDLSAVFVARAVDLYLANGGRFAFVMPYAALSRRQYAGFRTGDWSPSDASLSVSFTDSWDLHKVKPAFFPVPCCVAFGYKVRSGRSAIPATRVEWSGRLPFANAPWHMAKDALIRTTVTPDPGASSNSSYASRFTQGATLVPRLLMHIETDSINKPLGAGAGRRSVRSRRGANEKLPWKSLPDQKGSVERQFIFPMHLGETILPYRTLDPVLTVLPWNGEDLLSGTDDRIEDFPGLADWWRQAERIWEENRRNALTLTERINYQRGVSCQFPAAQHRVVYPKSGMYMAAARLSDPRAVVEQGLYWASASSIEEARYLTAILNSDALLQLVRPLQSRGEHNPRHFVKNVFRVPIPLFLPGDQVHGKLVDLSGSAEELVRELPLAISSFQAQRRSVRNALTESGLSDRIDAAVLTLLEPGVQT